MPRAARIVVPEMAVHVIQRGNNHGRCFFSDVDYLAYLSYLRFFARRYQCSIHAYCLMTNHVHLLLTPHAADACALLMKYLSQCYVQRVNKRTGRSGTLWEGRFRSCLVASEHYVLACYRYIELNPVRAGMVSHPADYPWSSYAANSPGKWGLSPFLRSKIRPWPSCATTRSRPTASSSSSTRCPIPGRSASCSSAWASRRSLGTATRTCCSTSRATSTSSSTPSRARSRRTSRVATARAYARWHSA